MRLVNYYYNSNLLKSVNFLNFPSKIIIIFIITIATTQYSNS